MNFLKYHSMNTDIKDGSIFLTSYFLRGQKNLYAEKSSNSKGKEKCFGLFSIQLNLTIN